MAATVSEGNPLRLLEPALWPEANIAEIILRDPNDKPDAPVCTPYPSFTEHVATQAGLVPKYIIAVLIYFFFFDIATAAEWRVDWMLRVVIRDLVICFLVAGGWDYLVYRSPLRHKFHKYKFNPQYPPARQLWHDMLWTVSATISSSAIEIVLTRLWATGAVPYYASFWTFPVYSLAWVVLMPYWRLAHFFVIHRMIHPWRTKTIPDVGRFLYRHIHSLHHQSPNPTAWSGISMHPVESTLYFSAALVPSFFVSHPLHFLITKVDLAVGAQVGHDGFGAPGGGSYYHYLHHAHFEINYGDKIMPLDWLFGTYGDGTRKLR